MVVVQFESTRVATTVGSWGELRHQETHLRMTERQNECSQLDVPVQF
jgi:hypothetical protein